MSYGSAQTRRSEGGPGGAPAMSATVAAATRTAPVSLPRVECMRVLPADPSEGEGGGQVLHRCRSAFAPAPGVLLIYLRRLVLLYDCLQPEHEQRAARVADVDVVTEGTDRADRGGRVLGADAERDTCAGPAADSGEHGEVLLAVGPQIRHRVADDPGGRLELPQQRAGGRIDRLDPAFHRAVEHDARGLRQRAAVGRQILLHFPLDFAGGRIPRNEPAAVTARAREHAHDRADVRLTGGVLHLYALVVHADVVRGDVEELGLWREGRWLLILEADRGGTDTLGILLRGRPVLRVADGQTRREIDLRGPVDRAIGLGHQHPAVRPS